MGRIRSAYARAYRQPERGFSTDAAGNTAIERIDRVDDHTLRLRSLKTGKTPTRVIFGLQFSLTELNIYGHHYLEC